VNKISAYLLSLVVALIGLPLICFCQYIDTVYDYDSSRDFGYAIFAQPDSNYVIIGSSFNISTQQNELVWMKVKRDGSQIISKHRIASNSASFYQGWPTEVRQLPDGGYIVPFEKQYQQLNPVRSMAGLMRIDSMLDTVFVRTYTDTQINFDNIYTCGVLADGSFLLGGERSQMPSAAWDSGLIIHADSMGNLLWSKTNRRASFPGEYNPVNSFVQLSNRNIAIGASICNPKTAGSGANTLDYTLNSPWFMIMDTNGNILWDTVYTTHYGGGGLYPDINGGYMTYGYLDSVFTNNPNDVQNFPLYIAHLDSNFRMTWIKNFADSQTHYWFDVIRELADSNYFIPGSNNDAAGWAIKINHNDRSIIWQHEYSYTSGDEITLLDAREYMNRNIVLTGVRDNPTEPSSYNKDVWLLEIDSNGCEVPGCLAQSTASAQPSLKDRELKVWPNPTRDVLNIEASEDVHVNIISIEGKVLLKDYSIPHDNAQSINTSTFASGIYLLQSTKADGNTSVKKLVVQ